jgi:hypothetical protein
MRVVSTAITRDERSAISPTMCYCVVHHRQATCHPTFVASRLEDGYYAAHKQSTGNHGVSADAKRNGPSSLHPVVPLADIDIDETSLQEPLAEGGFRGGLVVGG